ncbi:voltage-gated potassium channel [Thozetella sp. PMI_491]|nr:voltage-gated potassium channel [Thozetella sp. PMI_491]
MTGEWDPRRGGSSSQDDALVNGLNRTDTIRSVAGGRIKLRGRNDDLPQRWWFASTAIPLVAATVGPLSSMLSIAALVSPWRLTLPDNGELPDGADNNGVGIADPRWEIICNAISLAFGFTGNIFLLLNFTGRVRYIIALPLSILFWIFSIYVPPIPPGEIYSQGFWHAVLASILYLSAAIILTINIVGYFKGHYPQQFHLDDDQRTLILQTMMFFFWLAGGAGIFCAVEGWTFANALYYADVSILTIGFGDISPATPAGRGFLFVFELVGIIFLGLVISSISGFAANISADKIIKRHQRHARESTVGRTVTNENELRERLGLPPRDQSRRGSAARRDSITKYGHLEIVGRTVTFREKKGHASGGGRGGAARSLPAKSRDEKMRARGAANSPAEKRRQRRQKLLLLQEEKDRFEAMREIQEETRRWKQYLSLGMAFLAFGILWGVGALVFMITESRLQEMSYFDALYFCFAALLTIGYGDYSAKSNIGKPFFIVWSLIAVPIVTVLIQIMSRTVVSAVNRGTFTLADWTIMPKKGVVRAYLDHHPALLNFLSRLSERHQQRKRISEGFQVQDPDHISEVSPSGRGRRKSSAISASLERTALEDPTEHDLARELAISIKSVAQHLRMEPPKRYGYEEWVHFTKLIRFSRLSHEEAAALEEEEGLVEWDWIGEDSPMLADITEPEWVLDRLCESLNRYTRRQARTVSCLLLTTLERTGSD